MGEMLWKCFHFQEVHCILKKCIEICAFRSHILKVFYVSSGSLCVLRRCFFLFEGYILCSGGEDGCMFRKWTGHSAGVLWIKECVMCSLGNVLLTE
jgi:hypothetical protein